MTNALNSVIIDSIRTLVLKMFQFVLLYKLYKQLVETY